MPKQSQFVLSTDRQVRSAVAVGDRTDYRIRGVKGLQLRVTAKGTKTWALAYKKPGTDKWAKVSFGSYPSLGLADATTRALDLATEVRRGRDPLATTTDGAVSETFEDLAKRYINEHAKRNARGDRLSRSTIEASRQLRADIIPAIGQFRPERVARDHIRTIVEKIADRGSFVSADRALGLVRAIYNWAGGRGLLDGNPTLGLQKRGSSRPRTRVLDSRELRTFWEVLDRDRLVSVPLRDCYRLQLLTAARAGEVLGATECELDFDRCTWTIPAHRTKSGREHVLPLSPLAASIFKTAVARANLPNANRISHRRTAEVNWVFPSPLKADAAIDPHAATTGLLRLRRDMADAGIQRRFNTHDLRRTVATQLGELGVEDHIIERVLNHAPRTVTAKHYNHARHYDGMRRALEAWARHVELILSASTPGGPGHCPRFGSD